MAAVTVAADASRDAPDLCSARVLRRGSIAARRMTIVIQQSMGTSALAAIARTQPANRPPADSNNRKATKIGPMDARTPVITVASARVPPVAARRTVDA